MKRKIRDFYFYQELGNNFITFLSLILFIILYQCIGLYAQTPQTSYKLIEQAAFAEDWAKVVKLLDSVDSQTPSAVLRLIKAHACLSLNRNNESLCLFLSISSRDDLKKWEEWTKKFIKNNPQKVIAYYFRGDALARMEQWNEALMMFNEVLKFKPAHPIILNARGVIYAAKEDLDSAREDFKKVAEVSPSFAEAYVSSGTYILQKKTDAKIALEWFDKALQISPDYVLALNGKGNARRLLREWDMAASDLKKAKTHAAGCLSGIADVVDLNLAFLVNERNEAVSKMLARLGGIEPGMSINEKLTMMDKWTPSQRQKGFDLINNSINYNDKVLGGSLNPSKTDFGISGGVKGTQPYFEGKGSATWNWTDKAKYNMGHQISLRAAAKERFGITGSNRINDIGAWGLQHMPGMQYGNLTKPGGVSSREIGENPLGSDNWKVSILYGLHYKMEFQSTSLLD